MNKKGLLSVFLTILIFSGCSVLGDAGTMRGTWKWIEVTAGGSDVSVASGDSYSTFLFTQSIAIITEYTNGMTASVTTNTFELDSDLKSFSMTDTDGDRISGNYAFQGEDEQFMVWSDLKKNNNDMFYLLFTIDSYKFEKM